MTDPRVEDSLDVGGDGGLLAEGKGLVLEGGGLLQAGVLVSACWLWGGRVVGRS